MHVFCFMNQKGGAGKTTSAVHVAAALADGGTRTLLLDNDSQGNASFSLGLEKSGAMSRLYETGGSDGDTADLDALTTEARERLFVVTSDLSLADAATGAHERSLARYAGDIQRRYDALVIDNPPALDERSICAMYLARDLELRGAAAGIVVAVPTEPLAVDGMMELLETIDRLRDGDADAAPSLAALIPTLYDGRTNLASETLSVLEKESPVLVTTPARRNVRLAEAPMNGQPVYDFAPGCNGAEDYRTITDEITQTLEDNR
jgi:chromosome partitioning protein